MDINGKPVPPTILPCTRCLAIARSRGEAYVRHADDLLRIDGMCETCYRLVVIQPCKDEETRLMDILDVVRADYLTKLQRINVARQALKPLLPKPMASNGRYKCRKCHTFTCDGMIELMTHEEEFCKGEARKGTPRPRNTAGAARSIAESASLDDCLD